MSTQDDNQVATDDTNTAQSQPDGQRKIRKITIKTAVRAAGQSHNRYIQVSEEPVT